MSASVEPGRPGPLEGVRVVDLSRLLPGPYCTWLLTSLGAEVIRIDPPGGGDYARLMPPVVAGTGVFYAAINRGKRSVILDVRSDRGRDALHRLLETADVLVEGFKPGALAREGLAPAELRARHPRLVIASISGYGQTGPLRREPGHDLNYQGYAGAVAATADLAPGPVQVADLAGGALMAAVGICAALVGRGKDGQGRWLDISMTEGVLALMGPQLAVAAAEQRDMQPSGEMLTGGYSTYRTYRCADGGLVTVGPLEPKFQLRLAQQIGQEMLDIRPEAMAALFASRPRDAWVTLLEGCCVGPALTASELPAHPLHVARGAFESVLGLPMARSPFPWARSSEVAELGADTAEILGAIGLDPDTLTPRSGDAS
ncbi:MAG: CoA transferase [Alphaproteobacteria bacterium]|nr:CoA transferase [Alphaproteobacteria bacterium]